MDIQSLTQEMDRFVQSKGWYEQDSARPQTLRNLAISINLEAAEILEHFQWDSELQDSDGLESELADVFLYLLQLAKIAGIDLEKAVLCKLEKNYLRSWDSPSSE